MKLKKLPGFSLGLIALAVGNAYAEQFIQHDEYKHAVAIKDGKVKDIDNWVMIIQLRIKSLLMEIPLEQPELKLPMQEAAELTR
ncbi:hypothetical protein WDS79_002971 [Escherichia coli]